MMRKLYLILNKVYNTTVSILNAPYFGFVQGHNYIGNKDISDIYNIVGTDDEELILNYEQSFSKLVGDGGSVSFATGRMGFYALMKICGVGKGDEIIINGATCSVMVNAILRCGATPVYSDIDSNTFGSSSHSIKECLTIRTKMVVAQHSFGIPCEIDLISDICKKKSVFLLEDCALALGSSYKDKLIGCYGDITCFSFDGIKSITSGEGGCIVTDDQILLDKIRDARLLGVVKDTEKRFIDKRSWDFDVNAQGWRYHMSNIMAAIGIEQLKRFPEFSAKRKSLARLYNAQLFSSPEIVPLLDNYDDVVPHIYVIMLQSGIDREMIRDRLINRGIQTGIHYQLNHRLSLYQDVSEDFCETDKIYSRLLTLPLHPDLSEKDIEKVCEVLIDAVQEN